MLIDEDRIHTLTKYASTRGVVGKSESDHNPLFCEFDIPYASRVRVDDRQTIFNLKNAEGQEMFHELTSESEIFAGLGDENISVEKRAQMFVQKLNLVFSKAFKKIRVRKKCQTENPIEEYMKLRSNLKMTLKTAKMMR